MVAVIDLETLVLWEKESDEIDCHQAETVEKEIVNGMDYNMTETNKKTKTSSSPALPKGSMNSALSVCSLILSLIYLYYCFLRIISLSVYVFDEVRMFNRHKNGVYFFRKNFYLAKAGVNE